METLRARFAVCALLAFAMWDVAAAPAQSPQYGAPKPKPHVYWLEDGSQATSTDVENDTNSTYNNSQKNSVQIQQPPAQKSQATPQKQRMNSTSRTSQSAMQGRQQSRQQPRQLVIPNETAGSSKQTIRTATRTQSAPASKPKSDSIPTSMESLQGEKRAAFMKLIGANWIWSPAYAKDNVPAGDCYFRKTFQINQAEIAQIHVACDNE